MVVVTRREGALGYVELDNPPVNAIGLEMRQGLLDAVQWAEDAGLERVIVSGRGTVFAAGGDTREFDALPVAPHLPDVLQRIENSPVPWIAAAHGAALGGGLELMLACRMRVVAPEAQLGLPEVTLGVVPGAGGTQKLLRLIGVSAALELVPTGRSVRADKALDLGLVDIVAADPVAAAMEVSDADLKKAIAVGRMAVAPAVPQVFDDARAVAHKKLRGHVAPLRAIALMELAQTATLDEGMKAERQAFIELRTQDQARSLRHIFFAERGAKLPASLRDVTVPDVTHVAVVGGGTMGAGIAYALLSSGLRVTLLETDSAGVERATENVENIVSASLKRGLISEGRSKEIMGRFTPTTDYTQAADAGLAIEAAFESIDVKKAVLGALEENLPKDAVLATNTSYLNLDEMALCLSDPARLVGLHFFAPAHIMKLLEIVQGARTSDRAMALGFALGKRLRKIPVLSGVCDGFIGNRILARYREAADTLMMDGASPYDIDRAMKEFGYAMGPYEAQDMSGLDIAHANRRRQDATRNPNRRYITIADKMVGLGRLGRKTGAGWYGYASGERVQDQLVLDLINTEAERAGVRRAPITRTDIQHRLLLAIINEAADILHEGIAASATDIDLVTVFGYGFPRWRGGLMYYAETLGMQVVQDGLAALAQEDPTVWTPSPYIKERANAGLGFYD